MNWNKVQKHLRPSSTWPPDTKRRVTSLANDIEGAESDVHLQLLLQLYGNNDSDDTKFSAIVEAEGATVLDRFSQSKPHPLISAIRDARAAKLAALKAMNLDLEPLNQKPGRPPGR